MSNVSTKAYAMWNTVPRHSYHVKIFYYFLLIMFEGQVVRVDNGYEGMGRLVELKCMLQNSQKIIIFLFLKCGLCTWITVRQLSAVDAIKTRESLRAPREEELPLCLWSTPLEYTNTNTQTHTITHRDTQTRTHKASLVFMPSCSTTDPFLRFYISGSF